MNAKMEFAVDVGVQLNVCILYSHMIYSTFKFACSPHIYYYWHELCAAYFASFGSFIKIHDGDDD